MNPIVDGWMFDMAVRLLQLCIHHPRAASFDYKSLAATALAVVLGVPRVEECTFHSINMDQLDWMMLFLNSPSALRLANQSRNGTIKKRPLSGAQMQKSVISDLEYLLSLIIV